MENWPFDQPENCAVITLRSIVYDGQDILLASHDADDNGWQFLDGSAVDPANAVVVELGELVNLDPSLLDIADMPPGWIAWRDSPDLPWQRMHKKSDPGDESIP